jgi:hypothetical protein
VPKNIQEIETIVDKYYENLQETDKKKEKELE